MYRLDKDIIYWMVLTKSQSQKVRNCELLFMGDGLF